jgi:hypothetical protein
MLKFDSLIIALRVNSDTANCPQLVAAIGFSIRDLLLTSCFREHITATGMHVSRKVALGGPKAYRLWHIYRCT